MLSLCQMAWRRTQRQAEALLAAYLDALSLAEILGAIDCPDVRPGKDRSVRGRGLGLVKQDCAGPAPSRLCYTDRQRRRDPL